MEKDSIQKRIRDNITSKRGYEFSNNNRIPLYLRDSEIGVQLSLANMEVRDGKMDIYDVLDITPRVKKIISKFENSGIPLEVISDANGFDLAFKTTYFPKTGEKYMPPIFQNNFENGDFKYEKGSFPLGLENFPMKDEKIDKDYFSQPSQKTGFFPETIKTK